MGQQEYVGHRLIDVAVLPARVAYLIAEGSSDGFRAAVRAASHRWGGMTEPIIEATSEADSKDVAKLVRIADVQAVVNVDADASRATELGDSWKLPVVAIGAMYSRSPWGIWEFTTRPESMTNLLGPASDTCFRADPKGPLWAVAVAGIYDVPNEFIGYAPVLPQQLTLLGGAQSSSATVLQKGMAGFEESWAMYDRHNHELPVVVVIAEPDSLADSLWFWNARAMRSHARIDMPVVLFPQEAIEYWLGFANDIRSAQTRSGPRPMPDVILFSRSLSDDELHQAAARAELVADDGSGVRWIEHHPDGGERLTYRIDCDFEPELFRRRWGKAEPNNFHQFVGPSRFDVALPALPSRPSAALLRLDGEPFAKLPRKDIVAWMITQRAMSIAPLSASWHGNQLQIPVRIPWLDFPQLTLSIPRPEEVVAELLKQATSSSAPSIPGTIGMTVTEQSDISALLGVFVVEALTALKTERTEHFLKELRRLNEGRYPDWLALEDAKELAREFGGRQERKFQSATNVLNGWTASEVTPALEAACAQGWAERGLGLDCDQCSLNSFIPLHATSGTAVCPACSAPALYQRENGKAVEVVYRLNGFIDRAIDNGVLPHLLVAAALKDRDPSTYLLPGVDVVVDGARNEVDVFGIHEGKVLAGEVKVKAAEFSKGGQIVRDVALSRRLGADIHLMAATDIIDEDLQREARKLCERDGIELLVLHEPQLRPGLAEQRDARKQRKAAAAAASTPKPRRGDSKASSAPGPEPRT
ncbi:hypothetical protein [Streptomyces sp. G-G2]|uniref:hypothetical protein n=1 Tax=Streptomyces sp. G-G2 TaxID=3046201 RepID=UPI0024B90E02|nr:hypothetical protein [Streptomyces sp. G-G2]MDJ0386006.1 hypothetical protein [Streptomyces sp. G-G2]